MAEFGEVYIDICYLQVFDWQRERWSGKRGGTADQREPRKGEINRNGVFLLFVNGKDVKLKSQTPLNPLLELQYLLFELVFQIGDDCNNSNVASEVCEQSQEDEEVDGTDLSSLDNQQLCLRYQQVNLYLVVFLNVFIFNLAKLSTSIFGLRSVFAASGKTPQQSLATYLRQRKGRLIGQESSVSSSHSHTRTKPIHTFAAMFGTV